MFAALWFGWMIDPVTTTRPRRARSAEFNVDRDRCPGEPLFALVIAAPLSAGAQSHMGSIKSDDHEPRGTRPKRAVGRGVIPCVVSGSFGHRCPQQWTLLLAGVAQRVALNQTLGSTRHDDDCWYAPCIGRPAIVVRVLVDDRGQSCRVCSIWGSGNGCRELRVRGGLRVLR